MGADGMVRGLLPGNLKVAVVVCTQAARQAQAAHHLAPVSATLLGQAFAGALLTASLQKGDSRVNLQVECDGPLRGLFVDAGADGQVRGYAKNTHLDVQLGEGPWRWRPALGNSGFLSVLRDVGEEYYRSAVELSAMALGPDLNGYFATSDQVPTAVAVHVQPGSGEPLGVVAGVLVQALPDGQVERVDALRPRLEAMLAAAVEAAPGADARALLAKLLPHDDVEALTEVPVRFACRCSKERVLDALVATGRAHLEELIAEGTGTTLTCQFCATEHAVSVDELKALLPRATGSGGGAPPVAQA